MNLKKFAVRGIVFLAVFVALCMFFSGTVRTIITPKVHLGAAESGRLEERIKLSCRPAFPEVEPVSVPLEEGLTLTVTRVNSRVGYTVQAGEVIVEAKVTDYDAKYKQYQQDYDAAAAQLLSIESKNRKTRITQRDRAYADAYYDLQSTRHEAMALELQVESQLSREKLSPVETGYPEGASDSLKQLMDQWRTAVQAFETAQAAMEEASRYTVDEAVWSYITERREQQEKLEEAEKNLRALVKLNDQAKSITAPHDGYLAELKVNEGEPYDGANAMFTITPEDVMPVLRADLSNVKRTVTEGMNVTMESNRDISSKVVGIGTDAESKKYADIELTKQIANAVGSVYAILESGVTMELVYSARESTTLVKTSMLQKKGPMDYTVFIARKNEGAFAAGTYTIEEMKLTRVAETAEKISVKESLTGYLIAYGQDRSISSGDTVMEYMKKNTAPSTEE